MPTQTQGKEAKLPVEEITIGIRQLKDFLEPDEDFSRLVELVCNDFGVEIPESQITTYLQLIRHIRDNADPTDYHERVSEEYYGHN